MALATNHPFRLYECDSSGDLMWVRWYNICPLVIGFFSLSMSSGVIHVVACWSFLPFSRLNSSPLHVWTTFCFCFSVWATVNNTAVTSLYKRQFESLCGGVFLDNFLNNSQLCSWSYSSSSSCWFLASYILQDGLQAGNLILGETLKNIL